MSMPNLVSKLAACHQHQSELVQCHKMCLPDLQSLLERFRNLAITHTIMVSEQTLVTSSLYVFVNAKPVESCFEKRIRLVKLFIAEGIIIGVET